MPLPRIISFLDHDPNTADNNPPKQDIIILLGGFEHHRGSEVFTIPILHLHLVRYLL